MGTHYNRPFSIHEEIINITFSPFSLRRIQTMFKFFFFFFRSVLLIELSNFTLMINFDLEKHTEKKNQSAVCIWDTFRIFQFKGEYFTSSQDIRE